MVSDPPTGVGSDLGSDLRSDPRSDTIPNAKGAPLGERERIAANPAAPSVDLSPRQ